MIHWPTYNGIIRKKNHIQTYANIQITCKSLPINNYKANEPIIIAALFLGHLFPSYAEIASIHSMKFLVSPGITYVPIYK